MSWKTQHAVYSIVHDVIVHPICGLLWAVRGWIPQAGTAADRLHNWHATKDLPIRDAEYDDMKTQGGN